MSTHTASDATVTRVLLVEDNPDDRELIIRELERHLGAVHVSVVRTMAELDQQAPLPHDVAITDYQLQWTTGLDVLARLRQAVPERPVIMFTASGSEEIAVAALKTGADDYLVKSPRHYARVPYVVAAALQRRRDREAAAAHAAEAVQARAILRLLLDHVPQGILIADADPPRVIAASREACEMLACDDAELRELPIADHTRLFGWRRPDALERRERDAFPLQRALEDGLVVHDEEWEVAPPQREPRTVAVSTSTIARADGTVASAIMVWLDISERKAFEQERERLLALERHAREIAEAASRSKDEFLATLSHELRTPLNAMFGWLHLLESGSLPPERTRQGLAAISRNARLQARLVEDILDVSRIILGRLDVQLEPADIGQVARQAAELVEAAAVGKALTLSVQITPGLPVLPLDPRRMQQAIGNVLANAVKFTPEGGRVDVLVQPDSAGVRVDVWDTGPGIAPEFLPFIFDRFSQADRGFTRQYGGLGLGLAIARHIVQQHGGAITASSEGAGKGTHVVILLPVLADTSG